MESAYDRKFKEMKKYIPFLESMIKRLESTSSASANPRQAQLDKIRSLRDLLLDKKKRMKMENLLKCEQVLVNLYAKVEQRDEFSDIKPSTKTEKSAKEHADLETVRSKLKTVAKIHEGVETLPEIARANDVELHYTGSKEPALFQRRPNRSSKSPACSALKPNEIKTKSPQSETIRSYTRVLVSPDQSPLRWPSSELSSSDKLLFSRRSPVRPQTSMGTKKEKKKSSKASKSRKTKDLNITLNVPEESLNSLNTKDILSRIINCSDGDVDIDTLRELRSQILGELKQTGKNDDISDLILKSYNKKTNKLRSRRRDEVEEGELSDSESEAIESIYGSLVVMDKDKKSLTQVKTIEDKDNQQRKIQICLVINSDKDELSATNKGSELPQKVIDLSEFEMFSDSEENKSKDVISIDSDTSLSPPKKVNNKQFVENGQTKKKIDFSPPVHKQSIEKVNDDVNIEEDDKLSKTSAIETQHFEETNMSASDDRNSVKSHGQKDKSHKSSPGDSVKFSNEKEVQLQSKTDLEQNQNIDIEQEHSLKSRKFTANFYKPMDDHQNSEPTDSSTSGNNLAERVLEANEAVTSENKRTPTKELVSMEKDSEDDSQKIPLLNEPTVPPKAKTDVLSEIDILQALKNDILSETIAVPGSDVVTPALHQPKITKVASSQEARPKKRISIEKYKQKASTSTSKPLFVKKRKNVPQEDNSKKQSLKLTEKECERFNFPKRLSFDDDDDDDLSDDDYLTEDRDDSWGLDDIYGDLAPKSPDNEDNEVSNERSTTPVIIPTDPVKTTAVTSRIDVDMRALLPTPSPHAHHVLQPVPPPLIPPMGFGTIFPHGIDRPVGEANIEQMKKVGDRVSAMDPRMRRDLNSVGIDSPNPYAATNPDRPHYPNIMLSAPNMTPSRNPNMTPSRTPSMTPSYMPSIPLLMTPNAMSFDMTPSHQSFESEESSGRKHVYAPSFSLCDSRERESVSKDLPHWEINRNDPRSRRIRWEESSIPHTGGPKWEDRDPRSNSGQIEVPLNPRYDDPYKSKYDKYNNRVKNDQYGIDRRDSYSKADCPTTPIPSFGWSECPSTPGSAFGRHEAPMTPSHQFGRSDCPSTPSQRFGRSDCPTTPVHSFGRADCPSTPASSFGRMESSLTSNHSYGRSECPGTPSHSFGRSECPATPSHSFGRNDCPQTPSHPFGQSEVLPYGRPDGSNYNKDPRINRRPTDYESNFINDRDRDYQNERSHSRKSSSYKSQSKHYSDPSRSRERERSVGRYDKKYSGDRGGRQNDGDRREPSVNQSDCLYTKNSERRYDGKHSRNNDDVETRRDQRERSIGRISEIKSGAGSARSTSQAPSTSRRFDKENISFKSDAGRDFTINTSVNTTFQNFLESGKTMQVFDYTFDARRQRASSVGRSLVRENSVGRTLPIAPKTNEMKTNSGNKNDRFKRASSVGRELVNTKNDRSFQEVKADFESYRSNLNLKEIKDTNKVINQHNSDSNKDIDTTPQDRKTNQSKQSYSPRKNYRDPRMRKEYPVEQKSRYKIDRRSDAGDPKKSGIIYSSDNIAKGTIMGSGFGVKNYKIPKIKRVVEETKEVNNKEKAISIEKSESQEKNNDKESEKAKEKDIKEKVKLVEDTIVNSKNTEQPTNNKLSNFIDYSERRVTRSKNKTETKQSKEDNLIIKTKKTKKSVIYDSESDSGAEKEVIEKNTKETGSPSKNSNKSKKLVSSIKEKAVKNKSNEGIINSSFGFSSELEMFSENIGSDPVIENINALIADLDHDLDSSKISNDSFTELENMMEVVNSPEGNSLGDISEVIEKDLNESNELQQKLITDNILIENKEKDANASNTIQQGVKTVINPKNDPNGSQIATKEMVEIVKDAAVGKPINMEVILNESVKESLLDDTASSKVNEAIVSTTEIHQISEVNEENVKTRENIAKNEDRSMPDSTINKNVSDKIEDGLPDSTNEMHCELSSDVTSTYNAGETSKKESEIQSSTQNEGLNSLESLLSILQDKSKIKELLSMLGGQSAENDKIKKKLEKLSEIVSDEEEDENKGQRKVDHLEEASPDTKIENPSEQKESQNTQKIYEDEQICPKNCIQQNNEKLEIKNKKETEKSEGDIITANIENGDGKSMNVDIIKEADGKANTDPSNKIETDILIPLINEEKNKKEQVTSLFGNKLSNEGTEEANNLGDEDEQDDDIDDEPLIKPKKKTTRKTRIRRNNRKFKSASKNKPGTRAAPANSQPKKPVGEKKQSRELEQLQADIKEMFMSDDILNATGIRMCRLAKMVSEHDDSKRDGLQDSEPVVVLEKVKGVLDQPPKVRKKPGPKPKNKSVGSLISLKSARNDNVLDTRANSPETVPEKEIKMDKPKALPKKPGPKSKTKQKNEEIDPYEFDTDSVTDTTTTKESDDDSSDSENESLASSRSFGSSEVLADAKKKPKRKRRGIRGWQSGIIKPKHKKKKEQKQEGLSDDSTIAKAQRPINIPDLNCFTDKTYCFQKGVTTYDCRLCVYSGTDIVNHYKKQHPHTEIPLSRMDLQTAEEAILQCEEINLQAISKIPSEKYTCRFCRKEFGCTRFALETFFWHIVSHHTGEFKHLCSECVNVTRCPFNLDIPPPPKEAGQLIGYICGKCNFTQISLENLKSHVIVRHNDEQTEVYTINLAVMSKKAVKAMLRRSQANEPRVLRSLRSNQSAADISYRDDRSDDHSDMTESSGRNSESDLGQLATDDLQKAEKPQPKLDRMKTKLTFENDEPSDETSVKMEEDEHNADDRDETSHFDDSFNAEPEDTNIQLEPSRGNSDEIMDYPHFKLSYTTSGSKEYVCCINGNDYHYKTSLLISMKKHVQSKHSEKWDGYCCICKVIVTLQGVQSDFKDCLSHFLDKHLDDFPVLEKVVETAEEILPAPLELPLPLPALPPTVPARIATPSIERTASPTYLAVRPLAELISRELVKEIDNSIEEETPIPFPKIENIISLGEATLPPSAPSPVYPTSIEPAPQPDKPFLYEEVQAEVMSKKHRVVLDGMMSKENLVRVFKCAGRFCSFTSDSAEDALMHASTHQRVGGEGALNCAYCNYDACENGIDLVMHVFKEHSRCQYCCPLCFYRAAASQLVGVHYTKAHGGSTLKNVLRSTAAVAPPAHGFSAGLLTRDVAVQHFVCNHEDGNCNFKTYTSGKFTEHLLQRHASATSHPCNLCSGAFPTPAELVVHLRSHGLKLYQCTWCVHGANTEQEFLSHAATCHPDRHPQAYVRVITNKDGSSQLRVLPLAYLNKSKVPTEDVAPNSSKDNPVREAERSIELEKLIGHTLQMIEASRNQSPAPEVITDQVPNEEPVELTPENLPESENEAASALEALLKSPDSNNPTDTVLESLLVEKNILSEPRVEAVSVLTGSETSKSLETTQEQLPVKTEPNEGPKTLVEAEVICLDSDDEGSNTVMEEAPVNSSDDVTRSSVTEEVTIRRVSGDVSRSSITDDVSITKISDEVRMSISDDDSRQNIIDLSDDDPPSVTSPGPSGAAIEIRLDFVFRCPKKGCKFICKSANSLRKHVNSCTNILNMTCPHKPCTATVIGFNQLIEHYFKVHKKHKAPMPSYCGVCKNPFSTLGGAKLHIRSVHKISKYAVTMALDGTSTVREASYEAPRDPLRISKRKTSTEIQRYGIGPIRDQPDPPVRARKTSTEMKKRYGIEDIDKLPINPILDSQVYCDLCEFGTKVRLNMVRHLQQHAGSMPVPSTQPVNPVPHLETNEKHFDKMVNLASSSAATRAPDKLPRQDVEPAASLMVPPGESSRYPKFVSERQRYTCGAKGCSYISVDMAMFRCHWETLHVGDDEYRCVHCPPHQALDTSIPLTAARILAHLRMHDVNLYACSVCSYYHYRRHLVEKHLSETHKQASVKIVREEGLSTPVTPPPSVGAPTMDLKAWQCGLCKFSSMLRPEVVNHCGLEHQSKMQFKCAYCPFRTSTKENVVKHQTNAHPAKVEEVFYYFYREGSIPDDEDGTPRWQKQRQKLGLDSDPGVKSEPDPAESTTDAQAALTPTPSLAVDLNLVKSEAEELGPVSELSVEDLCKQFGQFCEPDGIKYKCSLCNTVREHTREAMQCHLYEELSYRRWECVMCSYRAFHRNGLNDHVTSEHSRQFVQPRALPVNVNIEKWVLKLLDHQTTIIETNIKNLAVQKIQVERTPAAPTSPKKMDSPKPTSNTSEAELELTFGEFGAPKNQQFSCPKCEFLAKDETAMVYHLETELTKIRWGCTNCECKFQTFHEAQFHSKSHTGQPARPKETTRDPAVRSGWITAVIATQRQFMKCVAAPEPIEGNTEEDSDSNENSLLVARYDQPVHTEEELAVATKRPAPADSDEERLIIDEPQKKKTNDRQCPYCDYTTTTPRCVREHILRHYNMKPYRCFHCSFEGARPTVLNHMEKYHAGLTRRVIPIPIPNRLPTEINLKSKREMKEPDDTPKLVCLYCEKSVPESETESHAHGNERPEFGKRGEVVVKCCKCLALRLTVTSLQEHFDACHPNERLNYAYFKLQLETREIHCCGHCYKKFKFLRDLKAHHTAFHTSLSLSFTSIPFNHNLHTEGDPETSKRKIEDAPGPSTKRLVARKSTSKLPNSMVAKKSTTKLPLSAPEDVEYSYYGTKPAPIDHYKDVTLLMPINNTVVKIDVKKLSGIIKIDPIVVENKR